MESSIKQINIELDDSQLEELKKIAESNCRSIRGEVKFVIMEYIKAKKVA